MKHEVWTLHSDTPGTTPGGGQRTVDSSKEKEKNRRQIVPLIADMERFLKYKKKIVRHSEMAEQELQRREPRHERRNRKMNRQAPLLGKQP